jgi:dienelactone hydrolase
MNTAHIHYQDGDQELEGYVAYDPALEGKRPAVLIAHAWGGLLEFERSKAEALARLGYIGFALDVYGAGKRGGSVEENAGLMQPFMEDRALVRRRMQAGLEAARSHELVDAGRIAVIGYCFGGMCVLDLARSGADVAGVVSFHGLLSPPTLSDNPDTFTTKVLVLHGHDDPLVPPAQVAGLTEELTRAKVDWQIHNYGHTLHAFTNPEANDPTGLGAAYDATADRRSWVAMKNFLAELFGE